MPAAFSAASGLPTRVRDRGVEPLLPEVVAIYVSRIGRPRRAGSAHARTHARSYVRGAVLAFSTVRGRVERPTRPVVLAPSEVRVESTTHSLCAVLRGLLKVRERRNGSRGDVDDAAGVLRRFVRDAGGCAVVDGGLATELEAHGADLQDEIWSARCLVSAPHLTRKVIQTHDSMGFQAKGLSRERSEGLLHRSVHIAQEARAIFAEGCYGAYLADGSEYTGDYGRSVTKETLKSFHRRRLQVLADAGPDLIAFETIPRKLEAQAYAELLEENDVRIPAWFSFTSKDGHSAASGDPITECAAVAESCARVGAVGVTSKPVVVYPNSGETYVAETKEWVESAGGASETDYVSCVGKWGQAGAALVGGCCRTSPATVRAISRALRESDDVVDADDGFPAVTVL
uniref:Hcy-binding domain-containing protein n=1 Tax=Oryza punctata TaxID=4537 RepID=A0A0E0JPA8_ORYPU